MDLSDYGDGAWKVVVVMSLLILMQIIMVAGRLYSRALKKSQLKVDDYVLLVATVFTFVLCGFALAFPRITAVAKEVRQGNGSADTPSPNARMLFIAWTIFYGLAIGAAKWAILLLYLRVFTTINRYFSSALYVVGTIITATTITNTLVAIFQCSPASFAWNSEHTQGTCIDVLAFNKYIAIPNIVTGIIMILMPLPPVLNLHITSIQKLAISATFLHGIIGLVASIIRLCSLMRNSDMSLNEWAIEETIWTVNEPANYVIAACLPTLRPLFMLILPQSFFVLSRPRRSRSDTRPYTSYLKISWPRGSLTPQLRIEKERFAMGSQSSSRASGSAGTAGPQMPKLSRGSTGQTLTPSEKSTSLNLSNAEGISSLGSSSWAKFDLEKAAIVRYTEIEVDATPNEDATKNSHHARNDTSRQYQLENNDPRLSPIRF